MARLGEELNRRLDAVEPLEVRLDVTTLWCYALGRELFYVPPGEDAPRVKPPRRRLVRALRLRATNMVCDSPPSLAHPTKYFFFF